jgi:AP-1 complex subunit gamma-1
MIDLDESPSNAPAANGRTAAQNDLASVLGLGSTDASSPSAGPLAKSQKSTIDDILGLFDTTPAVTQASSPALSLSPQPQAQIPSSSLFDSMSLAAPTPIPSSAPRLTAYTAYDKHNLKITLTPQVSPTKAGLVNILARFQLTGSTPANNLNFQAAVPKVCMPFAVCYRLRLGRRNNCT